MTPLPSTSPTTPGTNRPARPKLTLQTSSLPRTFGRSTTGLTLGTSSPTVHNTFKNAYDVATPAPAPAPAPATPSTPTTATPAPTASVCMPCPGPGPGTGTGTGPGPGTGTGTGKKTYQNTIGIKSILRNSPLEHHYHRRSLSNPSRRVFFPVKKRVTYRQPLDEEIRTVRYVAAHSDLYGSEDAHASTDEETGTDEETDSDTGSGSGSIESDTPSETATETAAETETATGTGTGRKDKKRKLTQRQTRVTLLDGLRTHSLSDSQSSSQTQSSSQSQADTQSPSHTCQPRKRREWRWTLGPLE